MNVRSTMRDPSVVLRGTPEMLKKKLRIDPSVPTNKTVKVRPDKNSKTPSPKKVEKVVKVVEPLTEDRIIESKQKAEQRRMALACGLKLPEYRILKALEPAGDEGMTLQQLDDKTGLYTVLGSYLRLQSRTGKIHSDNLAHKGLVREMIIDHRGRDVYVWAITAKGRKRLERGRELLASEKDTSGPSSNTQ